MNTSAQTPSPKSTSNNAGRKPSTIRPAAGVTYDKQSELLRYADDVDPTLADKARMTLGNESTADDVAAMNELRTGLAEDVAAKFRAYTPELPAEQVGIIRKFVEDAVILTLPITSYTVETLLRPAMHFVYWAVFVVGADLDAQIIFTRKLIEHYVRETMPDLTDGTRRNYRAWLFRVAEVANPEANPNNPMPLSKRALEDPYSLDDEDTLDRWAAGQSTPYQRENAAALLALGCGAGLSASEIVLVRREDITVDESGAVHVRVSGKASRTVVVRARYEKTLKRALTATAEGAFVFMPKRKRTGNDVVSAFIGKTDNPAGMPVVRARKMRNTWLVRHLTDRVDVTTLMNAAGLQSLESISRLAQFVPTIDEADRVKMLRGRR
jgi:integrase